MKLASDHKYWLLLLSVCLLFSIFYIVFSRFAMTILPWQFFQHRRHEGQGGSMWEAVSFPPSLTTSRGECWPRTPRGRYPISSFLKPSKEGVFRRQVSGQEHQRRLTDRSTNAPYFCQAREDFLLAGAKRTRKRLMTRLQNEVIGDKLLVGGCSSYRCTY